MGGVVRDCSGKWLSGFSCRGGKRDPLLTAVEFMGLIVWIDEQIDMHHLRHIKLFMQRRWKLHITHVARELNS
ncbi:hypothetical protein CR513_48645, partial [Mucuna pruriens]